MTLPALPEPLVIDDGGRIVYADTGELVKVDSPDTVNRLIGGTLDAYALAQSEAEAARLAVADMEARATRAAKDELATVPAYTEAVARYAAASNRRAEIQAMLDGLFANRPARFSIALDTGRVLVSWAKGTAKRELAHPAKWYTEPRAKRDLTATLTAAGIDPATAAHVTSVVFQWLGPKETIGKPPAAAKVTVRGEK